MDDISDIDEIHSHIERAEALCYEMSDAPEPWLGEEEMALSELIYELRLALQETELLKKTLWGTE